MSNRAIASARTQGTFLAAACIATHNAHLVTRTGANVIEKYEPSHTAEPNAKRQLADVKAGAANEPVIYT